MRGGGGVGRRGFQAKYTADKFLKTERETNPSNIPETILVTCCY